MFTYTTRKDGRLMKKVTINGKVKYLYSNNKEDLEKQYIEAKHMSYNGLNIDDSKITLKQWAEKWYDVNISQKEYKVTSTIISQHKSLNSNKIWIFMVITSIIISIFMIFMVEYLNNIKGIFKYKNSFKS